MSRHTTVTPSSPRLNALLDDVRRGNIKIPAFQRSFVWKREQILGLLDSIYRGYPVGSLLFWSSHTRLNSERNVGGFVLPDTREDYPVQYVLDGQQRLTTLFGAFFSNLETAQEEISANFRITFDPEKREFFHADTVDPGTVIGLEHILSATTLIKELGRFKDELHPVITDMQDRFKDYEFPVVTVKDKSTAEVCRIFQRINSSGENLGTLDLLAALTWSEKFDLRNEIDILKDSLAPKGFEGIEDAELMRCLTAIIGNDIDTETLLDRNPAELVSGMARLKEAVHAAVDFLSADLRVKNDVFVPFPIMLVPLTYYFALVQSKNRQKNHAAIRRWFWNCAFSQRYQAGTNRNVLEDLSRMGLVADGKYDFSDLDASVEPELFKKTWRINSTAAKAAICLMANCNPQSFLNGKAIDLEQALAAYNAREFHHIYPKAHLNGIGIAFHQANVIANICFLSSEDNKKISDAAPANYFARIPAKEKSAVLAAALIPDEAKTGELGYVDFIELRAKLLAQRASELIRG